MVSGKIGTLGTFTLTTLLLGLILLHGAIVLLIPVFVFLLWLIITILRRGFGFARDYLPKINF